MTLQRRPSLGPTFPGAKPPHAASESPPRAPLHLLVEADGYNWLGVDDQYEGFTQAARSIKYICGRELCQNKGLLISPGTRP